MKKKTKICGVCVTLAAVLLLSAALIVSCAESLSFDDLSVSQGKPNTDFRPPEMGSNILPPELPAAQLPERNNEPVEEMGYLQLNIVKENGVRTVLPGAAPTIVEYLVIPTNSSTSAEVTIARIAAASIGTAISVPVATYSVEVRGYATTGSNVVVAVGSASGVEVTASGTTGGPAAIAQHEVITGTLAGSGTFAWNFTLPTGDDVVDSATMTVTDWGSQSNTIPSTLIGVDVKTTAVNTTGVAIPSGYYYVDVKLVKAGHRTQTYREIVHIANGMTSEWAKNDFYPLSRNVYVVTYQDVDGAGDTDDETDIAHGATLTEPTGYTFAGHIIEGWYRNYTAPSTFTNKWAFATDKVFNDLSLYPKWEEVTSGNLNVTVSFVLSASEPTFTLSDTSVSFSKANLSSTGPHITVTLDNTGTIFTPASVVWTYNKGEDDEITWTGLSLVIDFNTPGGVYDALLNSSTYTIDIEAIRASDSKGYSSSITLVISD